MHVNVNVNCVDICTHRSTTHLAVGDRAFHVAAAMTWNSLLFGLTSASSFSTFRRQLKSLFTALHGMQSRYSDGNSVCPSVRLSVKRVHCDKTEESYV